eukprot:gb/GFBE01040470.1/.p1 GENE.gb/GFBE01040470.1/~~gb/GFBE01040470.1/.p1  ORF type:complete len:245 (+),score=20.63 gb/GFBE01040470.1/:1-735(+)
MAVRDLLLGYCLGMGASKAPGGLYSELWPRDPEPHIVLAWTWSMAAISAWQIWYLHCGAIDVGVTVAVHVLCLPLIGQQRSPRLLAALFSICSGILCGFQVIDMCFDLVLLSKQHDVGRLVWHYYNTMLNSSHMNAVLLAAMVITTMGVLVGLARDHSRVRHGWYGMVFSNVAGFGCYWALVIPRYLCIRASTEYEPQFFENWSTVLICRLWMFVCLAIAMLSSLYVLVADPGEESNSLKVHSQ